MLKKRGMFYYVKHAFGTNQFDCLESLYRQMSKIFKRGVYEAAVFNEGHYAGQINIIWKYIHINFLRWFTEKYLLQAHPEMINVFMQL